MRSTKNTKTTPTRFPRIFYKVYSRQKSFSDQLKSMSYNICYIVTFRNIRIFVLRLFVFWCYSAMKTCLIHTETL